MPSEAPLDRHVLDELREEMGDPAFVRELIDTFLEETPRLLSKIHEAADHHDPGAMQRFAHTLKSTSATFGAKDLARLLQDIETLCREQKADDAAAKVPEVESMYVLVRRALEQERA
jgi:HPt (histidine-containing phosphotransfer) domain-containing protein